VRCILSSALPAVVPVVVLKSGAHKAGPRLLVVGLPSPLAHAGVFFAA